MNRIFNGSHREENNQLTQNETVERFNANYVIFGILLQFFFLVKKCRKI